MAWTDPTISSASDLQAKVCRLYGIDATHDTELAALALDLLDETVDEMNSQLYDFNKRVETGITLTAGTAAYELNSAFYRESLAYLVDSSGDREPPLIYLPYARFRETYGDEDWVSDGFPEVYTIRNVQDDGQVTLGPTPDTSAAAYTLTVEYYRRIPKVSGSEDPLAVPDEVEPALLYGAMKRMAIHINGPGHADVAAFETLEARAIEKLKGVDRRHPDQNMRFQLHGHSRRARRFRDRALYIRID